MGRINPIYPNPIRRHIGLGLGLGLDIDVAAYLPTWMAPLFPSVLTLTGLAWYMIICVVASWKECTMYHNKWVTYCVE